MRCSFAVPRSRRSRWWSAWWSSSRTRRSSSSSPSLEVKEGWLVFVSFSVFSLQWIAMNCNEQFSWELRQVRLLTAKHSCSDGHHERRDYRYGNDQALQRVENEKLLILTKSFRINNFKNRKRTSATLSDKGIEFVSTASAFLNRKHRLQKRNEKATNVFRRSPMLWNLQWGRETVSEVRNFAKLH